MKVAIIQPYFFPYIGYFQLINSCDTFIFLDNVQFIKKGWINRNQILSCKRKFLFTIPLKRMKRNCLIKDAMISKDEFTKFIRSFSLTIQNSYQHALSFQVIKKLLNSCLINNYKSISRLAIKSVMNTCEYLDINKNFKLASELISTQDFVSMDRNQKIIELVKLVNGNQYINPFGGQYLYNHTDFVKAKLELNFLKPVIKPYYQNSETFIPSLSVIDLLMNVTNQEARSLANEYKLIK